MASADGAASVEETLEVLARIDLTGLSADGVRQACAHVLAPPPIEDCAELAVLPSRMREEIALQLLGVAYLDGGLVPAEREAFAKAGAALGLGERAMARALRRAAHERWERDHGIARADALDSLRNLAVLAAGFGAPVVAILWLGTERQADPRLAIAAGVHALGLGYGFTAGILSTMAISLVGSSLTSALTLRGRRADRLRRDLVVRAQRVRANLAALVEHLAERVREMQFQDGLRVGFVALENRYQLFQSALTRLARPPGPRQS